MYFVHSVAEPVLSPMIFDRKNQTQRRERYVAAGKMNLLDYSELVNAESLDVNCSGCARHPLETLKAFSGLDHSPGKSIGRARFSSAPAVPCCSQLTHPWVAAAIGQHSNAFADPVGRFHRTFSTVFAMVFGTLDQSMNAARCLHRRHATVTGRLSWTDGPFTAGSPYGANAIPALRLVYATLIETALVAYELVLPPLTAQHLPGRTAPDFVTRMRNRFWIGPATLAEAAYLTRGI